MHTRIAVPRLVGGPQQTVHNGIGMWDASSRAACDQQAGKRDQGGGLRFVARSVPLAKQKSYRTSSKRCQASSLKAPCCSVKVQQKLDHGDINLLFSPELRRALPQAWGREPGWLLLTAPRAPSSDLSTFLLLSISTSSALGIVIYLSDRTPSAARVRAFVRTECYM